MTERLTRNYAGRRSNPNQIAVKWECPAQVDTTDFTLLLCFCPQGDRHSVLAQVH